MTSNQPQDDDDVIEGLLRRQFDGPVPNEGFSERVMQRLPARRRRVAWPLWAGIAAGIGACCLQLPSAALLQVGWRDWVGGDLSTPAIIALLVTAGMSLLASWWGLAEADRR